MDIRTRKAIGCAGLLAYMGLYAVLAATLGAYLMPMLPFWAEMVFFSVAGIVWIFPLKPMFNWMKRP